MVKQTEKHETLATGSYSRLVVKFLLKRQLGFYLIQIYLPSLLIVVISWVSFWVSRDASPARVALGIMTVLTMTTLLTNTNAGLPKVSYIKSIDIYLIACYLMVFAALLEYAAVSYLIKMRKRKKIKASLNCKHPPPTETRAVVNPGFGGGTSPDATRRLAIGVSLDAHRSTTQLCATENLEDDDETTNRRSFVARQRWKIIRPKLGGPPTRGLAPSTVDKYSRVLFPLVFLIFNLLYWLIYTHISD